MSNEVNCLKQAHILETGIKLKRKNNTKTWPQPNTWKRVHLLGQEQNSADLSSATQKYFYKANTFTWDSENSWALKMKKEKKMARLRHFEKGVSLKTNKTDLIYIQQRKKNIPTTPSFFITTSIICEPRCNTCAQPPVHGLQHAVLYYQVEMEN